MRLKRAGFYLSVASALLSVSGCSEQNPRVKTTVNQTAALDGDLPLNPLRWKVITSATNARDSTMETLFGNDLAVEYARTNSSHEYPPGSELALVTWNQQEDGRWFGGKIPATPKSVEFVTVKANAEHQPAYAYQRFEGAPLKKTSEQTGTMPNERASFLLTQHAAVMP